MISRSLFQTNLKTYSRLITFKITSVILVHIFMSLLLYEQFFLPWRQHELSSQVTTIFISRKVRYETRLRPTSRALLHSAIREKLHPFLATIPSASRGGWFSILLFTDKPLAPPASWCTQASPAFPPSLSLLFPRQPFPSFHPGIFPLH